MSDSLPPPKALKFCQLAAADVEEPSEDTTASSSSMTTTISICTYNVLIQEFISPDRYPTVQHTDLVFDYDRRRKMLMQDIQQLKFHNTDIFCLEEMSLQTFQDIRMVLGNDDDEYGSHLVKRQIDKPLHNAMFYNKSKLQLERHYDVNLHKDLRLLPETLLRSEHICLLPFRDLEFHAICNHFTIRASNTSKGKNEQDKKEKRKHLLVMMAHLHHNPYHDVIKYAQMSCLINELTRISNDLIEQQGIHQKDIYTVICGDLNAQPSNQVYHLIMNEEPTEQSLEQETMVRQEWLQQRKQWLPLYEQIYERTNVSFFYKHIASVYGMYHTLNDDNTAAAAAAAAAGERGHPKYTNLTDSFTNAIDYIFYDKTKLKPTQLLEIDTELYEKEDFLPNSLHPSDHVILWARLQCL